MKKETLNEQKLMELWNIISSFYKSNKPFDEVLAKNGNDVTEAMFIAKYKNELGNWDIARRALYCKCRSKKSLRAYIKTLRLDRIKSAGVNLEKFGANIFDEVCDDLSPLFAGTLFLALESYKESSFDETVSLLKKNKTKWLQ